MRSRDVSGHPANVSAGLRSEMSAPARRPSGRRWSRGRRCTPSWVRTTPRARGGTRRGPVRHPAQGVDEGVDEARPIVGHHGDQLVGHAETTKKITARVKTVALHPSQADGKTHHRSSGCRRYASAVVGTAPTRPMPRTAATEKRAPPISPWVTAASNTKATTKVTASAVQVARRQKRVGGGTQAGKDQG